MRNFFYHGLGCLILFFSFATFAKQPVILIPGAASSAGKITLGKITKVAHLTGHKYYFSGYKKMFKRWGVQTLECLTTKDNDERTLIERSKECIQNLTLFIIKNNVPRKSLKILGHSMGGNIARLVVNDSFIQEYVDQVLTISTPHRGTIIADFGYKQYFEGRNHLSPAYRFIMNTLEMTPKKKGYFMEMFYLRTLPSRYYIAQDAPMVEGIEYYSISTAIGFPYGDLFHLTWSLINENLQKANESNSRWGTMNDGVIPTASMIHGKHLGHVRGNHAEGLCLGIFKYSRGCTQIKRHLRRFLKP